MSTSKWLVFLSILAISFVIIKAKASPSIDDQVSESKNKTLIKDPTTDNEDNDKNSTDTSMPKPKLLPTTSQLTYKEYLDKIADYCLSDQDYEEAYGNKSKVGVVKLFFNLLIQEAIEQIALDELRRVFQLKSQETNSSGKVDEEFVNSKEETLNKEELKLFQQKVWLLEQNYWAQKMFSPQDINSAEKFLDHKFPEVRQLFKLKMNKETEGQDVKDSKTDKKQLLNKLFHSLLAIRMDVTQALKKSDWNSANGDILPGGPKCKQNFN